MTAALAFSVDDLFIGEHRPEDRAPIHRGFLLVREAMIVHVLTHGVFAFRLHIVGNRKFRDRPALFLVAIVPRIEQNEEDFLRPAEVIHVGRGQLAVPVVGEAEHFELTAEIRDVLFRGDSGMDAGFLGELLRRKAERVPAHRVHDAHAVHAVVARYDVRRGVTFRVPHMKPVRARVREHVEDVHFLLPRQTRSGKRFILFPVFLPFRLNDGRIIARHNSSPTEKQSVFEKSINRALIIPDFQKKNRGGKKILERQKKIA